MKTDIYWYYPHLQFWMGGTSFIFDVITHFKEQKYKTTLVAQSGSQKIIKKFEAVCDQVILTSVLSTHSILYWIFFPFFILYDIVCCLKIMIRSKDGIHLATHYPSNFIVAVCSKLLHKNFYYYCYEPFPFFHNDRFIHTFSFPKRELLQVLSFLYGWTDIWATRQAKQVLTLNSTTQKMIHDVYGVSSVITKVGVDSKHFSPQKSTLFQDEYKNKKIITHSTDYSKMKNTDLAIEIFSKMLEKDPSLMLVVTSTQPDSAEKKSYLDLVKHLGISEKIVFKGLLSYSELPILYSNSWLYLSTSSDEMLGTTSSNMPVKQALSCGTPVLRSNITDEDVEDGVSGYLIDPHNIQESAYKGLLCLKDYRQNRQMGSRGREKIIKLYNWRQVAHAILNTIHD